MRQVRKDFPDVHGLCWSSVFDSEATAIMFFGDRIDETDLELKGMRIVNDDPEFSSWSKIELWQVVDVEPMPVFE